MTSLVRIEQTNRSILFIINVKNVTTNVKLDTISNDSRRNGKIRKEAR